jgi:hypothetical protein
MATQIFVEENGEYISGWIDLSDIDALSKTQNEKYELIWLNDIKTMIWMLE